jgi:hypothetical protein
VRWLGLLRSHSAYALLMVRERYRERRVMCYSQKVMKPHTAFGFYYFWFPIFGGREVRVQAQQT